MNYLISKIDCVLFGKQTFKIYAGAKYKLEQICEDDIFLVYFNNQVCVVNFYDLFVRDVTDENIIKFCFEQDTYIIFNHKLSFQTNVFEAKSKNKYLISSGENLSINVNGENIVKKELINLTFENLETKFGLDFLFFDGERKAVTIFKDKKCEYVDLYDEYNTENNSKIFMKRLNTCLNHGFVCECGEGKFEKYLVYLSDTKKALKSEFIVPIFMDCVLVGDYKFAVDLMLESNVESERIKNFFEEFDDYIIIDQNIVALIKKNTLAGIYKFDLIDSKIDNIINV